MSSLALATPTNQQHSLALFTGARIILTEAAVAGKSEGTKATYGKHFAAFAAWLGMSDPEAAVQALIELAPGKANALVEAWKCATIDQGLKSSTVNGRISALRTAVKTARRFGLTTLALDVDLAPAEPYRDCAGPGVKAVKAVLSDLGEKTSVKAVRDRALISLVYDLALRRAEVVGLDLADLELDSERPTVSILGKGRKDRERRTLPRETVEAIRAWLAVRGDEPGPLFISCDRSHKGSGRLTGGGFWSVCRGLGLGHPHGLRHSSITSALDLTGGNVRDVMKHSRHRDLGTVCIYDDRREDTGGKVAQLVAAGRQ